MAARLPAAIISPTAKHTATVIFLHGLGDTGHGWCDEFKSYALPHVKYIFPHAPANPVTLNGGMRMPSWFDIRGLTPDAAEDDVGINRARDQLLSFIDDEEKSSIPSSRIVVGGFSQGGAVALFTAMTSARKLGGVLAFSTWMPLNKTVMSAAAEANKTTPVLQCHGTADPLVPLRWGQMTELLLQSFNPAHKLMKLPGVGHSGCEEEMDAMKEFLNKTLA